MYVDIVRCLVEYLLWSYVTKLAILMMQTSLKTNGDSIKVIAKMYIYSPDIPVGSRTLHYVPLGIGPT